MTNAIVSYLNKFLLGYGYTSMSEFMHSLCPSFKYNLQVPTFAISSILAVASHYLGIGALVVFAMFVAVLVETFSGILASKKLKQDFESFRFSRCVLKVFIWISLVFITNCFLLECEQGHSWTHRLGEWFFDITRMLILAYFAVEYIVSILENLAVIDGKPKTEFINTIQTLWGVLKKNLTRKEK